jgi:hypothetical protein
MNTKVLADRSVAEKVELVERRIERRRERAVRHAEDVREEAARLVAKLSGWLPMLAVAGSLAAGFAASRITRKAQEPIRKTVRATAPTPSRGMFASILTIGATALRIATSAEVRTLWNALRAFRARRA